MTLKTLNLTLADPHDTKKKFKSDLNLELFEVCSKHYTE